MGSVELVRKASKRWKNRVGVGSQRKTSPGASHLPNNNGTNMPILKPTAATFAPVRQRIGSLLSESLQESGVDSILSSAADDGVGQRGSSRKRRKKSVRMFSLVAVLILAACIESSLLISRYHAGRRQANVLHSLLSQTMDTGALMALQEERLWTTAHILQPRHQVIFTRMLASRRETDKEVRALTGARVSHLRQRLDESRERGNSSSFGDVISGFSDVIASSLVVPEFSLKPAADMHMWTPLEVFGELGKLADSIALQCADWLPIENSKINLDERMQTHRENQVRTLATVQYLAAMYPIHGERLSQVSHWLRAEQLDNFAGLSDTDHDMTGALVKQWDNCSVYISSIFDVKKQVASNVQDTLRSSIQNVNSKMAVVAAILVLGLTACPAHALWCYWSLDTVMEAMLRYTLHIVRKTKELDAEKKNTETLLYRLLPMNIVEDLKSDKSVLAESYQSVTIYFSDIVGFTSIAAASNPIQVVTFLNQLYTEFDTRMDLYDVYKVETIGDAYMIVSGCPRTNGIRHAGEIATFSLDLLNMIQDFRIPHLPDTKLMLRIGLHSGPCLAAVVGAKMPRYCLFGETVNIASRMESTGQPLRIQTSDECKKLLDKLGKYEFDERGQVEVKDSEFLKTHWLTGKDGYSFKLKLDVCMFIPKKVKLDRVIVKKKSSGATTLVGGEKRSKRPVDSPSNTSGISSQGSAAVRQDTKPSMESQRTSRTVGLDEVEQQHKMKIPVGEVSKIPRDEGGVLLTSEIRTISEVGVRVFEALPNAVPISEAGRSTDPASLPDAPLRETLSASLDDVFSEKSVSRNPLTTREKGDEGKAVESHAEKPINQLPMNSIEGNVSIDELKPGQQYLDTITTKETKDMTALTDRGSICGHGDPASDILCECYLHSGLLSNN